MADSTCDLSKEIIEKYDIGIAPLNVIIDNQSYKDRVDLEADDFYRILKELKDHPTTSMPSPEEYLRIIKDAVAKGQKDIICICMSSGTSGSYQSGVIARNYFFEDYDKDDVRIEIIDSKSMSQGSGWLIMKSCQMREEGRTFEEIIEFNENYKKNIKHFLCVDDLDNLIKSGRLTNASAFIGKLLKIKPIMSMKNAKGAIVAKERGRNRVLKYYIDEYEKRVNKDLNNFIIIGYTTDKKIALDLEARLKEVCTNGEEIYIMQMGAAVGTHVGSGGISMFFLEKGDRKDGLITNEIRHIIEKKDEILSSIKGE